MSRVYNFSAGPSMLPLPVLEQAQKDMLQFRRGAESKTGEKEQRETYPLKGSADVADTENTSAETIEDLFL